MAAAGDVGRWPMEKRLRWLWLLWAVAAMAREAVCSPPAQEVKEAILKMARQRIADGSNFHATAVCVNREVALDAFHVRIIISVVGTDDVASISGREVKRRVESEVEDEQFDGKYRASQESGRPDVKIPAIRVGSPLAVIIRCITSRRLLDVETARESMITMLMEAKGGMLDEDVFGGGDVCLQKTISTHGFHISILIVVEEHKSAEIRGTEVKRRVLGFLSDSQKFQTMYNGHPHRSGTAMKTILLPERHDSPLQIVMYCSISHS